MRNKNQQTKNANDLSRIAREKALELKETHRDSILEFEHRIDIDKGESIP